MHYIILKQQLVETLGVKKVYITIYNIELLNLLPHVALTVLKVNTVIINDILPRLEKIELKSSKTGSDFSEPSVTGCLQLAV